LTIPNWQAIFLPLLRLAADGTEHRLNDAVHGLAAHFGVSEDELHEVYPHSGATIFGSRVRWANVYLIQAGILERMGRGRFRITKRGQEVLQSNPNTLNVKFLEKYKEFLEFRTRARAKEEPEQDHQESTPPEEVIETAYQTWRAALSRQLLDKVLAAAPSFFEQLVVDLLVAMDYGGSRADAGKAIGKSGDEGIDGIISEDRLGLDVLYIQAKRWQGPVGRKEVQAFSGALDGQRANKGVMITTSKFTPEAQEFAKRSTRKIVLLDGERLAELMIDHGIGVSDKGKHSYVLKDIDTDYFEEV